MLTQRSQEKEILDLGPGFFSREEYSDCLKKLFKINQVLGIFRDTMRLVKKFSEASFVADIGCGGGLFLLNLSQYFPKIRMLGIDISADAIQEADATLAKWKQNFPETRVAFQLQDLAALAHENANIDILVSSLVCHHLSDEELVEFLKQAKQIAKQAVIIHDLHRHRLAELLYRLISPLLFQNRLITHDGLISIRRGFKYKEWLEIFKKAEISAYKISWRFPFRWQIVF